jgi:acetyltransferase-like isoleucine patch superfamily enzyme
MLATIKEFYGRFRRWVHWSKIDCKDRTHLWSPGVYIQDTPHIHIGKGVYCGPNVGIIVFNHCPKDPTKHFKAKDVYIGNYCWLGMNCVILPGVRLGDFTTVGAGAVVTKSFPEGHCVIAGVPAKIIKKFDGA